MPSAGQARRPGDLVLRKDQALADHSRKTSPEEHQQFGSVAGIEAELRALSKDQQAGRQRRIAIDADQRLRTDQVACRSEQRMPPLHRPHLDAMDAVDRAAKERRIDMLNIAAVSPKALVADDK